MTAFTQQGSWFHSDAITVDGKTTPGWVRPTSIRLEKNSPLDKRRLIVNYEYKPSADKTPPSDASTLKLVSAGDGDFVSIIPDSVDSIVRVQELLNAQMSMVFRKTDLAPATVSSLSQVSYGQSASRDVYPLEHDGSPTGYMAVWGLRHVEQYVLGSDGELEIVSSSSDFRCGWWSAAYKPQDTYTYPETKYFTIQHRYASWPTMVTEAQKAAVSNGYLTEVEQYRRKFA